MRVRGARRLRSLMQMLSARRAFARDATAHQPRPPERGVVMEVGAGQSPYPGVDVVVEKYLFDNFERPNDAAFSFTKPVVVADGESLPFADHTFAYCVCLHVLEHATDPILFASEITRVAGAGFVQVPSRVAELTFGWPYHPWLIDKVDDRLIFEPKGGRSAPCGDTFHRLFAEDALTRRWFNEHRALFHHSVEWSAELRVEVSGAAEPVESAQVDVEKTVRTLTALCADGALPPLPTAIRDALRCPQCRGLLREEDGRHLACATCARRYPLVKEVPVLLLEAAS